MECYKVEVGSPQEIGPAKKVGVDGDLEDIVATLMVHDHQSAVRGRYEELDREEVAGYPVVKRKDGGNTYYHTEESNCFQIQFPLDMTGPREKFSGYYDEKRHKHLMDWWGEFWEQTLSSAGYEGKHRDGDVYDSEGKRLDSLSADMTGEKGVLRGCWYESQPDFDGMPEADGRSPCEDSFDTLEEAVQPVEGLQELLEENYDPEEVEVEPTDEWREIPEAGRAHSSCI